MSDKELVYCRMPIVPERKFPVGFAVDVARAIIETGSARVPGTVLTYCFLNQPPDKSLTKTHGAYLRLKDPSPACDCSCPPPESSPPDR